MRKLALIGGSLTGLALALGLSQWASRSRPLPPAHLISDAHGALADICIQYRQDFNPSVIETLTDLFEGLDDDLEIRIVVERRAEFEFLKAELARHGVTRLNRLSAVITGFPITPWARDRFGALTADGEPIIAVPPARSNIPGARGHDERVPEILAGCVPYATCRPLSFMFEGGDLLADEENAFISANCLGRNSPLDVDDREGLLRQIKESLGKRIVVIGKTAEEVPDHHICMVLTPLGNKRVAVADPWLGLETYRQNPSGETVEVETDLSKYEPFRIVRQHLERQGFQTVPIPLLLTKTPRVFLSYNNVILERCGGEKRVYMPIYGVPALDQSAGEAFEKEDWHVIPVRVAKLYRHTGSLRCQVGIIRRR